MRPLRLASRNYFEKQCAEIFGKEIPLVPCMEKLSTQLPHDSNLMAETQD
jgi:hypothetical protein